MSNQALRFSGSKKKMDRAIARSKRKQNSNGVPTPRWKQGEDRAISIAFNNYRARSGEIRACTRLTRALIRKDEIIGIPTVEGIKKDKGYPGTWVWDRKDGVFISPWLTQTWWGGLYKPPHPMKIKFQIGHHERIARQKQLVGWLNSAADLAEEMKEAGDSLGLKCLRKFFEAGVKGNGGGPESPYCSHIALDRVVGRISPARLIRRMIEVRFAALRRMKPLLGEVKYPSWAAVAVAAVRGLPVGKASITTVAMTLAMPRLREGGKNLSGYKAAREWLINNLKTNSDKFRIVDGVKTILKKEVYNRHGVAVVNATVIKSEGKEGRNFCLLGMIGEFTYHSTERNTWWIPRVFAREAVVTLQKQRSALTAKILSRAVTQKVKDGLLVILANQKDSYDAGNCVVGTDQFIHSNGWEKRRWVDASLLISSVNVRARAAGNVSVKKFEEWVKENNISF